MKIRIGKRDVGDGCPCYTIAEVGSNFDHSLERCYQLIDLAKQCGADAVKFQCFKAESIVSSEGFKNLKVGFQAKWKKPVYQVYQDAEFPREWLKPVFDYCRKQKITFLSTPYDLEALDLLDKLGMEAIKIGSGDITWLEFIDRIARKGKPVILATGASTASEVDEAVKTIHAAGNKDIIILQCVTNYPASIEGANIRAMESLRDRHKTLVGYSDHTPGHLVALGTVARGGCMIEKHFTDDKKREGPDHPFAMDAEDFTTMVKEIRLMEQALGKPEKTVYAEEHETVVLQRRCVRASCDIPKGTMITRDMLIVLRPAPKGSLAPRHIDTVVGKRARTTISAGQEITKENIEGLTHA
jgi:sialic acid synthase SpsE